MDQSFAIAFCSAYCRFVQLHAAIAHCVPSGKNTLRASVTKQVVVVVIIGLDLHRFHVVLWFVSLVVWASAAPKIRRFVRVSGSLGFLGKSYLAVGHAVIPSAHAVVAVCIYETGELETSLFRPVSHAVGRLAAPAVAQDTYAFALMLSEVRDLNGMPLPGDADSLPFDSAPLAC